MPLETHSTSEITKTVAGIVAFVAFVVILLTWVPEWVGSGGPGAPETGKTVKMLK